MILQERLTQYLAYIIQSKHNHEANLVAFAKATKIVDKREKWLLSPLAIIP